MISRSVSKFVVSSLSFVVMFLSILASPATAGMAPTGLELDKAFGPSTIGPGSVSTLTFTITNTNPAPVTELAFTDDLESIQPGLTIAAPAFVSSGCGGTLTAPEGGTVIELSDGQVGANSSCQITVDVTGSTAGSFDNLSEPLTSSVSGVEDAVRASATLTIANDRPGFSKSFSPDMVQLGGSSTLTFTIDNSANGALESGLEFSDTLPPGLEIANPANLSNSCNGILSAPAGGSTITLLGGFVLANEICNIVLDVRATAVGRLDNRSSDLSFLGGTSGKASDSLTVEADELALIKSFIDDPVPPGSTTTLELSLTNLNRLDTATGLTFTDDLDATLSGLEAVPPLPTNPCGAGSTLTGTSLLTLVDGVLAPGESCTFQMTLQVPAGAPSGSFPNTTSNVMGDVGGSPVIGSPATDTLEVRLVPVFTKEFIDDPVGSGGSVTLRFTLVNTSSDSALSDIAFTDDLNAAIAGLAANGLVSGQADDPELDVCGAGSELTVFDPPDIGPLVTPADPTQLIFTGGNLATAGSMGDSCTFDVVLDVPPGVPGGIYPNATSEVTATANDTTQTGPPAEDDLAVVGAPTLTKEFTDDPVLAGDAVTLEFTISLDEFAPGSATGIAFTDDLDAVVSGLTALGLPQNDVCGAGSQIAGDPNASNLSFTGGTLAPGESCTFSVTLQIPMNAPAGTHPNTTGAVTATVAGVPTIGVSATDDLIVAALTFTKEFIGDPVLPGSMVILRFTLENVSAEDATGISFSDNLNAVIPGMTASGVPPNPCGGTLLALSGGQSLSFSGGVVNAGDSCTFDVTVQVPSGAASDTYLNTTSNLTALIDGEPATFPGATDDLVVDANLLAITKEFTDDPANPGGTVTLEFTIDNLSGTETVTAITFTDDLDATLSGLESESGVQIDVCGMGSQLTGTSVLTLMGGNLDPGTSCTFSATLRIPNVVSGGGTFPNVTSEVSGMASGVTVEGGIASDDLQVNLVAFSKSFDGPVGATDTAVLTFTIENLSTGSAVTGLGFTDDLNAVIPGLVAIDTPQSDVCGTGSQITGSSLLVFSGGSLDPSSSCSFDVTVQVPGDATPGSFLNTTSSLTQSGIVVSDPATASLQIEPPPAFAKVFDPNAVAVGGISALTFTIDNTASAIPANELDFTDDLPAGLAVAATPNASSTCGGTVTAIPGAGALSFTGGTVPAGSVCEVVVDVVGTSEGTLVNTSGELTSTSGNSGTATDTIDVVSGDFVFLKSFRTEPVLRGALVEMELTVVNGSVFPLTDIALTDDLGAVLPGLTAEGLPLADECGAGSQVSGTSVVTVTGGNLAPGASCTIVVPVRVPADASDGTFVNTTSPVTAQREGVPVEAPPDSADLVVDFLDFTKEFSAATVMAGETVDLTFTLTNPTADQVTDLTFTDDLNAALPGLTAVDTPQSNVCGAGSQLTGDSVLTLTGGLLGPGASCSFTVTVQVPEESAGSSAQNITSPLSGTVDGVSVTGGPAEVAQATVQILAVLGIPTLSFWMMLLMAGLLAAMAVLRLRL